MARPLALLADYIVACFQRGALTEGMAYQFGALLVDELHRAIPGMADNSMIVAELQQVITYTHAHLPDKLTLRTLADVAGSSPATLIRLFHRQLSGRRFSICWNYAWNALRNC